MVEVDVVRLIKRYGSRKLYDTEESRYVSLEEVAAFVRAGQEVRVVDNASEENVTTPTLAQIILEEGRSGRRSLPSDLLHELVRLGGRRVRQGVGHVQDGASTLLQTALGRLTPVREAREELDRLRLRLSELEGILRRFEDEAEPDHGLVPRGDSEPAAPRAAPRRRPSSRPAASRG